MMMKTKMPMYIAVRLESGYKDSERKIWLPLPATKKEFEGALEAIDSAFGDFEITCYNVRVPGICRELLMESPLARVNFLAARLAEMDEDQILKLAAIIDSDRYFTELEQFINYTFTHERFTLISQVKSEEDLGLMALESIEFSSVPPKYKACIGAHKLGSNLARLQDGQFTALGYVFPLDGWYANTLRYEAPVHLNLVGAVGEDLYGDIYDDMELFGYEFDDE